MLKYAMSQQSKNQHATTDHHRKSPLNFQSLIEKLNRFFMRFNVIIAQPYGLEVGAGTSNPMTAFRVLGPEPFNVAYVEPSRRPADGRYGENPNRLQHYFQYQVILKPAPRFNTYMYIELLEHLGIDPQEHDIRFVEDNWESPSLGAWGLGWEIWLDGMEITQYTYFQQMFGVALDIPALEITIGLERLAMYLQNVDNYQNIKWNNDTTYGDLFKQHEYWQTKYNYQTSDIAKLEELYKIHLDITINQIEQGNYWAAYDNLLKLSHYFNLLDAKGVISAADRVARFAQMGKLGKQIAQLYLKERKSLNYPLKNVIRGVKYTPPLIDFKRFLQLIRIPKADDMKADSSQSSTNMSKSLDTQTSRSLVNELIQELREFKATDPLYVSQNTSVSDESYKNLLLIELGFEEIPAQYAKRLSQVITPQFIEQILHELNITDIKTEQINTFLTPQRIVVTISGVPTTYTKKLKLYGPPQHIAYKDTKPTKSLLKFLESNKASLDDIKIEEQTNRIYIEKQITVTVTQIAQNIVNAITSIRLETKYMRWNSDKKHDYIRPLRWILSIHNNVILQKLKGFDIESADFTMLPRYMSPAKLQINSVVEYFSFINLAGLVLDPSERERRIFQQIPEHAHNQIDLNLVQENVFLTENPQTHILELPTKYKILPYQLISKILESNQRYLVYKEGKKIKYGVVINHFWDNTQQIALAHTKVINARLDDGLFYFEQDIKQDIKMHREKLRFITYHPQIGSYLLKTKRLEYLLDIVLKDASKGLRLKKEQKDILKEVFQIIKNDKATQTGKEFPELEGYIAAQIAKIQGYEEQIVETLNEYAKPMPKTILGKLTKLLDILDDILVLSFKFGLPSATKDPYQIRHKVYQLLALSSNLDIDLQLFITPKVLADLLHMSNQNTQNQDRVATQEQIDTHIKKLKEYIHKRTVNLLKKHVMLSSHILLAIAYGNNLNIYRKLKLAEQFKELDQDSIKLIYTTAKRIHNILRKNKALVQHINTEELEKVISSLPDTTLKELITMLYTQALKEISDLKKLALMIDNMFNKTLLVTDDPQTTQLNLKALNFIHQKIIKLFNITVAS